MFYLFYITLFLFGLAAGSFLNVVIFRYQPEGKFFNLKKLFGRSHCPHCRKELNWFELIPVLSFIIQRGKCRSCQHKIFWQYPLVEILTGLVFAGLPLYLNGFYGLSQLFFVLVKLPAWYYFLIASWILVFLIWILIAFIDLKHYLIPNGLNLSLLVFGIITIALIYFYGSHLMPFKNSFLSHYAMLFSPFENILLLHILGAVIGALFLGLLFFLSRGKGIGFGDVKLAFALGLVLGWPDIGLALMLSFIIGGLVGVILILFNKKTIKSRLPFAPFLITASVLTVFLGTEIIRWYFQLFNA